MGVSGTISTDIMYATHPTTYVLFLPYTARFGTRLDLNIIDGIPEFSLNSASAVPVVATVSIPQ